MPAAADAGLMPKTETAARQFTKSEAERETCAFASMRDELAERLSQLWHRRADVALGYESWSAYAEARLRPMPQLKLGERRELVATLRSEGMSTRAIAAAAGVSQDTAARDVRASERNQSVERVKSLDGRSRPARAAQTPQAATRRPADPDGRLIGAAERLASSIELFAPESIHGAQAEEHLEAIDRLAVAVKGLRKQIQQAKGGS